MTFSAPVCLPITNPFVKERLNHKKIASIWTFNRSHLDYGLPVTSACRYIPYSTIFWTRFHSLRFLSRSPDLWPVSPIVLIPYSLLCIYIPERDLIIGQIWALGCSRSPTTPLSSVIVFRIHCHGINDNSSYISIQSNFNSARKVTTFLGQ